MVVEEVVVPRHVLWWLVTGSANHCLVEITISSKQTAGKQHRLSPTHIFFFVHATYCVTNLKYSSTKLRWRYHVNDPDVFRTSLIESSGRITEEIFDNIQVIFSSPVYIIYSWTFILWKWSDYEVSYNRFKNVLTLN